MALFSDLLPYILQQQQTALPGGPNLGPAIPRSPTNVTAMNMPSAKLPGAFDFANAGNNFANVMGENVLRQQQAHLADLNAQHVGYQISLIPEFRKALNEWVNLRSGANAGGAGGAGAGGSEQGGSLLGSSASGGGATGSGKTVSLAMQEPPEVQAAVAKKLALESGIQHWAGIDPDTGKPWNQPLFNALQAAGLPTSGPLTEEQWAKADPLVQKFESKGGQNIPNYKFGPGYTAGGTHQITNSTWNMIGGPQIAASMRQGAPGETITVPPGPTPAASAPWAPGDMKQYARPGDKGAPVTVDGVTYPSQSAWNRAMDAQATATALQPGDAATPVTPQGEIPEVPSYKGTMGETPPPAAEDNDAALAPDESPGFAGRALAGQMQGNENLSPREQLNQAMLARLGGGQVAGEGAPSGGMSGGALPGILAGQMPTPTLPGRDPSLSMPFNPAAQAAAGPSPAVPSAPAGGSAAPTGTAAAGMTQALAAAKAAMPQGQQGGFQLDPMQAQMLKLGMLGQLSGMGNLTAPLERAFENSPWWAQRKAAASAAGAAEGKIPYLATEGLIGAATAYAKPENNVQLQSDLASGKKTAEQIVELKYGPMIRDANKGVDLKYAYPIALATAAADWSKPEASAALQGEIATAKAAATSPYELMKELARPHMVNGQLVIPLIAAMQAGIPIPGLPGVSAQAPAGPVATTPSLPPVGERPIPAPPPLAAPGGVGVPGLGAVPPGGGVNPAVGGAGVISSGMTEPQRIGLEKAMALTNTQLEPYLAKEQTARQQEGIARSILDLLPQVRMGWGADTIQQGAKIMDSIGVPRSLVERFTHPQYGDDLNKLFLQYTSAEVRAMGAREPGSVISLFQANYPNLETHPQAAQLMVNALRMQSQWAADRSAAAQQWVSDQRKNMGQFGENYQGLTGFENSFNKTNNPHDYWRAAAAMAGEKDVAWKGLDEAGQHRVFAFIPQGEKFVDDKGNWYPKPGGL